MAESYKLTYFNVKALAEPIRLIFAYAGVPYEDIRIERESWPEKKESYPFGQLPVLQVGDKTLSQSTTIGRYLGRKFNIAGEDEWEAAKIDEYVDALTDLRMEWRKVFMEKDEAKKEEIKKTILETAVPKYLSKFESQIGTEEGPYVVGKKISWLDITLAHWLQLFVGMAPGMTDPYPNLKKLVDTVFETPQIKEWVAKRPVTDF